MSDEQDFVNDLLRIVGSDEDRSWRKMAKRCAKFALPAGVAAAAYWGPGLTAAGSVTLPGIGTVAGATAALLVALGAGGSVWAACMMTQKPALDRIREELSMNPPLREQVKSDLRMIAALHKRHTSAA
ncbi:hypothetical protein ACQ5SO_16760 [Rhodovulum sp. DZ06]|uniref:hypothetical protein n=1 Tax=Rhodovulum sp. DZ06 TaxID=3425126 RepID=UPI003D355DAC